MARPKLRSADQPVWLRSVLCVYEFCASLKLAVFVIAASAIVLGWATFVEKWYGLRGVQFGVYGTWWFSALNALLALNIFCAAAIRFPWKRHQTGFVITHLGLLTLLFGCLLSRRYGIDAQMPVFEGGTNHLAFEDSQHIRLEIYDEVDDLDAAGTAAANVEALVEPIPLRMGPFNWRELEDEMPLFPWRFAGRDRGTVYDADGVQLEVLDYLSNCREVQAPYVRLRLSMPNMAAAADAETNGGQQGTAWMPIDLETHQHPYGGVQRRMPFPNAARRANGFGDLVRRGGGAFAFWVAGDDSEKKAFLDSAPIGELGPQGQIVLHVDGIKHTFQVDQKLDAGPFDLGDSGASAAVTRHLPAGELLWSEADEQFELMPGSFAQESDSPAIEIAIERGELKANVILFAERPHLNQQAYEAGVIGSYWIDRGDQSTAQLMQGRGGSRIDILAAGDGELYYRYWNRTQLAIAERLPSNVDSADAVDAFKMPMAQLEMYVEQYVPSDEPQIVPVPEPFNKDLSALNAVRAAKVRLTLDGEASEFWLVGPPFGLDDRPTTERERRVIRGSRRAVALSLPLDVVDVGFQVRLREFERKLDPGTSQASHYGSQVDFLDLKRNRPMRSDVSIVMNAPVDFSDPESGRSYRLFQESFNGPFLPGDSTYENRMRGRSERPDQLFLSFLTVNYDPGRGTKYTGSLLIVAGIATMFYMRAYFFKPQGRPDASKRTTTRMASPKPEVPQPVS